MHVCGKGKVLRHGSTTNLVTGLSKRGGKRGGDAFCGISATLENIGVWRPGGTLTVNARLKAFY
jgi:hypothetical protein